MRLLPLALLVACSAVAPAAVTSHQWNFSLDLGASYASGNTDATFLTLGLKGDREIDRDIYAFSLAYAFSEEDGVTTSDSLLAEASWKRLYRNLCYTGLRFDGRHDDLADINYRVSLSALLGRYLIKSEETSFSLEAGPGFTVEETGDMSREYLSVIFGQKFKHQLTETASLYQSLTWSAPVEDLDDFQIVAEAGVETKLTEWMNLKVSVEDKYENVPAAGRTENDFRFVTGVAVKF